MSAARHVGRRFVPPLPAVPISEGTEPRRERPRMARANVTPRTVHGSFTSRFRVPSSDVRCGAAACQICGPSRGMSARIGAAF